jgi:hypothetical protein
MAIGIQHQIEAVGQAELVEDRGEVVTHRHVADRQALRHPAEPTFQCGQLERSKAPRRYGDALLISSIALSLPGKTGACTAQ